MGLPAVRRDLQHEDVPARPRFHVVEPRSRQGQVARSRAVSRQAVKSVYVSFVVVVGLVAALGVGRVWMSASAARSSIEVAKLQSEVKAAQDEASMLEVRKSALSTPSRIQSVAVNSLGMIMPAEPDYLDLASVPRAGAVHSDRAAADTVSGSALSRVAAKAMGVVAGEAQQLLVGDVGLASD